MLHRHMFVVMACAAAGLLVACGAPPTLDEMEAGTPVTVATEDGDLVSGELAVVDDTAVVLATGDGGTTRVERDAIAEVRQADEAPAQVAVTVPAGGTLGVSLSTTVASNANGVGDPVEATLSAPLVQDGRTVAAEGSTLLGRVTVAEASGRVSGRAVLELQFERLRAGAVTHEIRTDPIRYVAEGTRAEDARNIGIGAGIGALVGAIADGGSGAAVGAAVGAAGGTAVVLSTTGDDVNLGAGTPLEVRLAESFTTVVTP